MRTQHRVAAFFALGGGMLAMSWSAILVRWTRMPGLASALYRMIIATLVLWALFPFFRRTTTLRISRRSFWITVAGGIFFAGDVGLWNIAVMHTSAGNATFLSNISPLFVGLLTWALTRRLPSSRFWTALVVSTAGTCLIVMADLHLALSRSGADGLAVIAAFCFAAYLIITSRLREQHEVLVLVALSTTASAFALLISVMAMHVSLAVPGVGPMWALLGMGLGCQVGGYFALTYALGHLPATVTSILWLCIAPLTAILAWILFGERMGPMEIAGGLLVLAGVWIVGRREKVDVPQIEDVIPPVARA